MDPETAPEAEFVSNGLSEQARRIIQGRQRPSPLDKFKAKPPEPAEKPTKGGRKGGLFKRGG